MNDNLENNTRANKIINIKTIGTSFLIILLVLILLSKTIYTYNLPIVTAATPQSGKLNKSETTKGVVDWALELDVYSELGGWIDEVLVSEGDKVTKGQPFINMRFDKEDTEKKLRENEISQNKLTIDIQNINLKMEKTNRNIEDLKNEVYKTDPISDYDKTKLENDIKKAEEDYDKLKVLFDAGAVTQKELNQSEFNLEALYTQYENLLEKTKETEEKAEETIADKEKARQKQLADYEYDLQTMQQDLKTKNLDLANLKIQEETYIKALNDFNKNKVIYAPKDGAITSLKVKEGQYINANQQIASMGLGQDFIIEVDVSLDNSFITVGDEVKMNNSSHTIESVVSKITPHDNGKKITLLFQSDEVATGETFEVKFEKQSVSSYILVPNGAINRDSDGYFVYQIKTRNGILGKEYYAKKLSIHVGDSDSEYTAVTKGITFFEPIVLLSDKAFQDSDTIKIKNESDFFAS